ncbi:CPBP family intramembrane glutamic endopeptidase [Aquilutibacter rugosus]|uniref:CPBP family intramembrane glutamic endopeptidase n=1 Tax=Aquilutibacter rugosus TaxID=3115820 RepID=UPI002F419EC4
MNDLTISESNRPHWGVLGTTLWGIVLFGVFSIAQTVGALGAGIDTSQGTPTAQELERMLPQLVSNGNVLIMATLLAFVVTVPLMLLVIRLKRGSSIRDYLALHAASLRDYVKWIAIMAIAVVVLGLIGESMNEKSADAFTQGVFDSANNKVMLFLAVAVLAPVFEELFFRGFLYKGLANSRLGVNGAIVLTSLLWAVIHLQYDWYPIFMIFVMGVLLGLARHRTGSIGVPIAMHAFNNFSSLMLISLGVG